MGEVVANQEVKPKRFGKVLKIFLFIIVPILILIVTGGVYLINREHVRNADINKKTSNATSPWAYSANTLPSEPKTPTSDELEALYQKVQTAILTRDYASFVKLASSERIWHLENPKRAIRLNEQGQTIYERIEPKGKENFDRYAPYGILYNAPNPSDIVKFGVKKMEPSTRPNIIMIDNSTGKTEEIELALWKYSVELGYQLKDGIADKGEGRVSFVWDKDAWKYNGEFWLITPHQTPLTLGDTAATDIEVTYDMSGLCIPQALSINSGQTVGFRGINGRVYSIEGPKIFDTGFLYNDNYQQRFDTKGTYTYLIQSPPTEPQSAKECTITVN